MENLPEGFPGGVKYTEIRLVLQVLYFLSHLEQMDMKHIGAEKQRAFQSGLFPQLVVNVSGNLI